MARLGIFSLAIVPFVLSPFCPVQAGQERIDVLDPARAGPEFRIQGEYTGKVACEGKTEKVGVQVYFERGLFYVRGYHGGLPGDGWDGKKSTLATGTTKDGVVTFQQDEYTGKIKNGVLTVTTREGKEIGKMERVIRKSPTLGAKPPPGAVVLFDEKKAGESVKNFVNGKLSGDGYLLAGTHSKQPFGACKLHLEFRTPWEPNGKGQGRGNSGVYLQGRFEVQVLDSFGLVPELGDCGSIYSIAVTRVPMCFPPLSWQTYDIEFTPVKEVNGKKLAFMTVRHNGILIHENQPIHKFTTAAQVRNMNSNPEALFLQWHGHRVCYRNIWLVEKK